MKWKHFPPSIGLFPSQIVSSAEFIFFFEVSLKKTSKQTVYVPVIWATLELMWRHCDDPIQGCISGLYK